MRWQLSLETDEYILPDYSVWGFAWVPVSCAIVELLLWSIVKVIIVLELNHPSCNSCCSVGVLSYCVSVIYHNNISQQHNT